MARPLRINFTGAWYHVINRGINQADVFLENDDYLMFLSVLGDACLLFDVEVSAYCLMNNHYHLLARTPQGNLPRFMRHLSGVYTQKFNRHYKKDGPLFKGRYKAILVENDLHLLELVRYIHLNPVKAGMTDNLASFPWSSHRYYVNSKNCPKWIIPLLDQFSKGKVQALNLYKDFIKEGIPERIERFYNSRGKGIVLGSEKFVTQIKDKFAQDELELEVPQKRDFQKDILFKKIVEEVLRRFNVTEERIYKGERGKVNDIRALAILLAREKSGLSIGEIAQKFNIGSYKTISAHCYRMKRKIEKDKELKRKYREIFCNMQSSRDPLVSQRL